MEVINSKIFNLDKSQALQAQLYQQLVDKILGGQLPPGTKLMASRALAAELGISRNTVTQVIEQLKLEGFLHSKPGQGVFISAALQQPIKPLAQQPEKVLHGFPALNLALASDTAQANDTSNKNTKAQSALQVPPFTPGVPDLSEFPKAIWSRLANRHVGRLQLMQNDSPQGYPPLLDALCDYLRLSRGVCCEPEQIIITNGTQEALSLCAMAILQAGDTALVESPGYIRARQAFKAQGAVLQATPLKNNHLDVEALTRLKLDAKLLYTTPTHQYPLGGVLPIADRLKLLDWAIDTQTWLIEDDYDSEFSFYQKTVPAMQGIGEKTPVLYMGSFSKTLFPGLRMGYLVVPKGLGASFLQAKSYLSSGSNLINQAIVADFIEEGHFVRHLRRMRLAYKEKYQDFCSLIHGYQAQHGEDKLRLISGYGGMHLALETPGQNDKQLKQQLNSRGFGCSALSGYYLEPTQSKQGLVFGFSHSNAEQRRDLIKTLGELL